MDEREDDLAQFMERWRRQQRKLEKMLYGEPTLTESDDEPQDDNDE